MARRMAYPCFAQDVTEFSFVENVAIIVPMRALMDRRNLCRTSEHIVLTPILAYLVGKLFSDLTCTIIGNPKLCTACVPNLKVINTEIAAIVDYIVYVSNNGESVTNQLECLTRTIIDIIFGKQIGLFEKVRNLARELLVAYEHVEYAERFLKCLEHLDGCYTSDTSNVLACKNVVARLLKIRDPNQEIVCRTKCIIAFVTIAAYEYNATPNHTDITLPNLVSCMNCREKPPICSSIRELVEMTETYGLDLNRHKIINTLTNSGLSFSARRARILHAIINFCNGVPTKFSVQDRP